MDWFCVPCSIFILSASFNRTQLVEKWCLGRKMTNMTYLTFNIWNIQRYKLVSFSNSPRLQQYGHCAKHENEVTHTTNRHANHTTASEASVSIDTATKRSVELVPDGSARRFYGHWVMNWTPRCCMYRAHSLRRVYRRNDSHSTIEAFCDRGSPLIFWGSSLNELDTSFQNMISAEIKMHRDE